MNREKLLQEMRDCIGIKDPINYFEKMTELFNLLFNKLDFLESEIKKANLRTSLAIHWEPKAASTLISDMIEKLREARETNSEQIHQLKKAFIENKVTQNYQDFCKCWEEILGYHPFLEYK